MNIVKTVMHTYSYDTSRHDEAREYDELCAKLRNIGLRKLEFCHLPGQGSTDDCSPQLDRREVQLETEHLFADQWNTAPIEGISDLGLRVFDWKELYFPYNRSYRVGHWLEQTDQMAQVRLDNLKCGYCGRQYHVDEAPSDRMCAGCIGNKLLEQEDLHLLRLLPAGHRQPRRASLTDSELAVILPKFQRLKLENGRRDLNAEMARRRKDYTRKIELLTTERDGMLWLLERDLPIENVIFYGHTETFRYGWRDPVTQQEIDDFVAAAAGFPFKLEGRSC